MVLITPAPLEEGDDATKKHSSLRVVESSTNLHLGRRLVEYFVVVSSVPRGHASHSHETTAESSSSSTSTSPHFKRRPGYNDDLYDHPQHDSEVEIPDFVPVITARYPLQDYPENPLHENVTFFCHPSGGIRLHFEETMPKVHYFAATGGTGQKMYGTCLTLWEPFDLTPSSSNDDENYDDEPPQDAAAKHIIYIPKCLVILSTHQYLAAFREYLVQLHRLCRTGDMVLPLERYIVNFCAEIPAPPPGSFEVQTTILDSVIKIWSPPHNQPIAWVSLPFQHLFECLDVEDIILVWHCLALERQVLLTSTQLSLLTECAEVLLSLLFPMRWSHAYIPLLPHFLIPILSAPMPFFCGIHKANLADALCDLSRECVVVDLDKNLVTMGPDTAELPEMPPQLYQLLTERLNRNVGMMFREARSLTKHDDYSERGIHLPPHTKLMADAMWEGRLCLFDEAFHLCFTPEEARKNLLNGNDTSGILEESTEAIRILTAAEKQSMRKQSQWDGVQEAFLDAYVYLLRNYRKFLVFPSKDNEGSYGGAGFRSKEFVQTQRYDMQDFLQQLIGTQMFDDFVTKRLYGSGEADVTFFDMAVDRFLKNQGLLANASWWKGSAGSAGSGASTKKQHQQAEPLLQSARVHRKLKTIVPPEPSGEGLPPHPLELAASEDSTEGGGGGPVVTAVGSSSADDGSLYNNNNNNAAADDVSVGSASTRSTTSRSVPRSPSKNKEHYRSIQDKAAGILEKSKYRYTYPTFPSEFNPELFGTPRPLPSAVISEFDRQRKDAARFRRKKPHKAKEKKRGGLRIKAAAARTSATTKSTEPPEAPPSAEVATFTLFFMAFSAMVGKELMDISDNPLLAQDRTILATYTHPSVYDSDYDSSEGGSVPTTVENSTVNEDDDDDDVEEFEDAQQDEQVREGVAEMKTARPEMGQMLNEQEDGEDRPQANGHGGDNGTTKREEKGKDDEETLNQQGWEEKFEEAKEDAVAEEEPAPVKSVPVKSVDGDKPRSRFRDSLSALQIEEAKATGRAQLALAFEMLTMMKKRGLKADPEAYQCLIDACGRVGDTQRATELLGKMHGDGIVADGVVYSCLVAAFSVKSAWKQASDVEKEELPAWANGSSIEMDWNKLQKQSFLDSAKRQLQSLAAVIEDDDGEDDDKSTGGTSRYQKLRNRLMRKKAEVKRTPPKLLESTQFYVTEPVEMQIELGENLLEIVYPDISVDTDNETCPRCNFLLSDDDVVAGWTPSDSQDYTTSCPNCMQRFVPHFRVQSTSSTFMGSRGPASPLLCERLSPWVLQKEIRSVMCDLEGIENLLNPEWREKEVKNAVLWWNLVLSCMRYRFPFSFLLQGSFEQNLIAPMPEQDT